MNLRTFRGEKSTYEPEYRQLNEIYKTLADHPVDEDIFLASNFRIASGEIDCLILKNSGPILLELKAYRGEIFGSENGEWAVRTNDGEIVPMKNNVFEQARRHRLDFIKKWERIVTHFLSDIIDPKEISWVASWAYFQPGSHYCGDIDLDKIPWFKIITRDSLIRQFQFIRTSYQLYPKNMERVMEYLGLVESPLNGDISIIPDETFTEYLQYAEIFYEQKNYTVAQRYINKCLSIDPGNKEAQHLSQMISWFLKN
jgi:tetratricopeptide (TPR) repeat protein